MTWNSIGPISIVFDGGDQGATSDTIQAEWTSLGLVVDVDVTGPMLRGADGQGECTFMVDASLDDNKIALAHAPIESRLGTR